MRARLFAIAVTTTLSGARVWSASTRHRELGEKPTLQAAEGGLDGLKMMT